MTLRRKLSVSGFLFMGRMGLFAPYERVELLDGEIYTGSGSRSGSPPSPERMVKRLAKLLEGAYGEGCIASVQEY